MSMSIGSMMLMAVVATVACGGGETSAPVVTETIDQEGGEITSDDGMATLRVLPGAVVEETEITVQRQPELKGGELYTNLYRFGPDDVEFRHHVPLEIEFSEQPGDETVVVGAYVDDEPMLVPAVDEGEGVMAEVLRLADFGAVAVGEVGDMVEHCELNCDLHQSCTTGPGGDSEDAEVAHDACVADCLDGFDEEQGASEECLEAAGAWNRCSASLGCSSLHQAAVECEDERTEADDLCSSGAGEVPDDPAFLADPEIEGPGGDASLVMVVEIRDFADVDDFETFEVSIDALTLRTRHGQQVEVDVDVDVDFAGFEPETKITLVWDAAIPHGTYTDLEFSMDPIEIVYGDDIDKTDAFEPTGRIPMGSSENVGDPSNAEIEIEANPVRLEAQFAMIRESSSEVRLDGDQTVSATQGAGAMIFDTDFYEND